MANTLDFFKIYILCDADRFMLSLKFGFMTKWWKTNNTTATGQINTWVQLDPHTSSQITHKKTTLQKKTIAPAFCNAYVLCWVCGDVCQELFPETINQIKIFNRYAGCNISTADYGYFFQMLISCNTLFLLRRFLLKLRRPNKPRLFQRLLFLLPFPRC